MDTTYFDERTPNVKKFPLPVFANQAGYKTNGIKRAVLTESSEKFSLVDSDTNVTVYQGTCTSLQTSLILRFPALIALLPTLVSSHFRFLSGTLYMTMFYTIP